MTEYKKLKESYKFFKYANPEPGEEVVISGFAGRFPKSNNVEELKDNLFNGKDCITDKNCRWELDHPEIPKRIGKINNIQKFDALFFGIHFKQAHIMDPMSRMMHEHTYEAIVDAGINPEDIRGTRTGVFIATCFVDSEASWLHGKIKVNGFGITGCSRDMMAQNISFWLGATGPSFVIDSGCSSSLYAMEHAYRAIRSGQCDYAIVAGSNLCLHPYVSRQFTRLGVLNQDGRCKVFDEDANGYVRSEGVSVAFLQKAKTAKRIYATIIHAKTNCDGYKEEGITFPSNERQSIILKEFYKECGVSMACIPYIEAHGTGTIIGDLVELNSIDHIFTNNRVNPLKVGSIKSNIGHTEGASGISSIAKVIISMELGLIPPNINFNRPRKDIQALTEGRIEVVTESTPLEGEYIGINSFGFGGANAHLLLKSNPKIKFNNGLPDDDLPRVVAVSGRTVEAVDTILNAIDNRPVDVEFIRLLHDIHLKTIPGHLYRGYTITDSKASDTKIREIESFSGTKRPICFVFSGMDSQWLEIGQALMRFAIFAESIEKCNTVLKSLKLNAYEILTERNDDMLDNILHSFIGITAVQIGIVDLLTSMGVLPDYMIGYSVGELGCAYADGSFTTEETILAAYSQGISVIEAKIPHFSVAVVGLGYKDVRDLCPDDIDVAYHNGSESSTIIGPAESMKAFVEKLQTSEIIAKVLSKKRIPYHSRYIATVELNLLANLKKVIQVAKPRSSKWLSTSVSRNEWSTSRARFSSAEYFTNNLMRPVLFEETSIFIPNNAVTIQIAPHSHFLQEILGKLFQTTVMNIELNLRDPKNTVKIFLQALGKLYNAGLQLDLAKLYPSVKYPVSRGTPMISPLIRWEHSNDWFITHFKKQDKLVSGERIVSIAITDEDFQYINGHVVDGRNLFPATGYLCLVWESFGMTMGQQYTETSVIMENIKFNRATIVPKEGKVDMTVMIQKGSSKFEVVEGGAVIITGNIRLATNLSKEKISFDVINRNIDVDKEEEELDEKDIYKEFKLRGYQYSGLFRSIHSTSVSRRKGYIEWKKNWVAFMDSMLQMIIFNLDTRDLVVPIGIQKLVINTNVHEQYLQSVRSHEKYVLVQFFKNIDVITAGGVEIHKIRLSEIARKRPINDPVIEEYKFTAYRDTRETSLREILTLSMHIALENVPMIKVKTIELVDDNDNIATEELVSPVLLDILNHMPMVGADVNVFASKNKLESIPKGVTVSKSNMIETDDTALFAIGCGLLTDGKKNSLKKLLKSTKNGAFLLSREKRNISLDLSILQEFKLHIVLEKCTSEESWILLRKTNKIPEQTMIINVKSSEFNWLQKIQTILASEEEESISNKRIILVEEGNFESGLLGFINCLRKEPGGNIFRAVLIQDLKAPKFSLKLPLYSEQLETDLVINVLRPGNTWGSYRHQLLSSREPRLTYHAIINQLSHGDLSTIRWVEGPITKDYQNEDLVSIHYASLNFKDVMLSTGKITPEIGSRKDVDCAIGFEYSGISISGRRIMGVNRNRCLSNFCQLDEIFSWTVPDNWSLEDAATVPCIYCTCIAALYINGDMQKGDKILIHAGSGGIGQAAINLALREGCEVFTTVGSPEKRKFIKETFPTIDDNHIGNSRDTSFEKMILLQTEGAGVDIILNSLAEDKLQASLRCLTHRGRFLEIGKFDLAANNQFNIKIFTNGISFHCVMLDKIINTNDTVKKRISSIFNKLIKENAIKPILRTVFGKHQVETAFRFMAAGKHMGKVLIKIREENESPNTPVLAEPSYTCIPHKSYIVLGGLGGFGLELIDWLVLRNAQNIVITSRNGVKNGYQRMRIKIWESYGVNIKILVGLDAAKKESCEHILKTAISNGPIDGIFNVAVSLKDSICRNQTPQTFEEPFIGKAWATKCLDETTRKLCPDLRHFVVFSSVSCGRGNAGQTNYGMANSIMERICEKRVGEGLPGLAIQWGTFADVGLLTKMKYENKELIRGTLHQEVSSCLKELNRFLVLDKPIVSSMVVAKKQKASDGNNVVDAVLNIMGIKDLKNVKPHTTLAELGMDSIMAVEIKQTLGREYEIYLTMQYIRRLNFARLMEMNIKPTDNSNSKNGRRDEIFASGRMLMQFFGENPSTEITISLKTNPEKGRNEIFFLPGVEGYGSIFKTLESKIKSPATCFQLAANCELKTIQEMANLFLPHMLEKLQDRNDFVLVGFSFGSLVAIELTRKLEAKGFNGRLVLIDGAPLHLKTLIQQQLHSSSQEELESNILLVVLNEFGSSNCVKLELELKKCNTWNEKINAFFNVLSPGQRELFLNGKQLNAILSLSVRLQAGMTYNPEPTPYLRTPITLFKPLLSSVRNAPYDYGLQNITEAKVDVHVVDGDHVTMLEDIKIAMAINDE
ncbi:fatty acid synthase-like [Vespula squamosa]|uniref:Fatty acid synthase-like n=1 Tax=Vespula squamosa TaxID=30214 RepID=A0ABD2A5K4_VESSQ